MKNDNGAEICIVAAIGRNRELGINNKLLWSIPKDLEHFKKLTMNHPVIMGRKTFDSIGKVLPERLNIIVSRNTNQDLPDLVIENNIEAAISLAGKSDKKKVFIIGGASVYKQTIKIVDRLYLTIIDDEKEADTFFPVFEKDFKNIDSEKINDQNLNLEFAEFIRR